MIGVVTAVAVDVVAVVAAVGALMLSLLLSLLSLLLFLLLLLSSSGLLLSLSLPLLLGESRSGRPCLVQVEGGWLYPSLQGGGVRYTPQNEKQQFQLRSLRRRSLVSGNSKMNSSDSNNRGRNSNRKSYVDSMQHQHIPIDISEDRRHQHATTSATADVKVSTRRIAHSFSKCIEAAAAVQVAIKQKCN